MGKSKALSTSSASREQEILDTLAVAICAWDVSSTITFWNAGSAKLYGWSQDEAIGRNVLDLLKCEYGEPLSEREAQLFETGTWHGRSFRHAKDGSLLIVDTGWSFRSDVAGAPVEIIEVARRTDAIQAVDQNSTELMGAYQALAESEKKYRDLFNFMPIALWQLDSRAMRGMFADLRAAGVDDFGAYITEHPEFLDEAQRTLKITVANERALHLFGATDREELLKVMPGLWLRRAEDWVAADQARRSGAKYFSRESTIRRVDDSIRDVLFSVAFASVDDSESLNTVGAIDITEEKQAKESLKQSERKYRTLFQYMPIAKVQIEVRELLADFARLRSEGVEDLEAYIGANPEFLQHAMQIIRVVEGNDLCCRLFGAKDSAELSGPVDRFFKVRPDTLTRSLAARYSGCERFMEETRLSTLDGRVLDLLYTSTFSPELSELGIGLVGMIDISDRLNAERKLQEIQAEFAHAARVATLGELAASIAHEVNQPLTAIAANGQASLRWLDREPPDIGEVRTLAGRIVADVRRAGDVVARIRNMAAHKDPRRDPVDLGEVVRETVEFLGRELKLHQINIDLQLAEDLPAALGDRTQLQQVVLNLAMNAAHAIREQTPDRRQLVIRAAKDGDRVRVEIEDTGPGIPEADRARLFNAFFTTKEDGLGLGLSICRSIIDYHRGEIRHEPLATGTRFVFRVPVAGQPAESDVPQERVSS